MSDKLDIRQILGTEYNSDHNWDQGLFNVSDPDFNDAIKRLEKLHSAQGPVKQEPAKVSRNAKKKVLKPSKGSGKGKILRALLNVAVLALIFIFFINIPNVSGSSMAPALEDGDRIIINRLARNYEVGDIIVFKTGNGEKLVKRIVAADGDVVEVTPDRQLKVNGDEFEEEYIYTDTPITDITVSYPIIVDEDSYFVLGDNRSNSKDSRNSEVGLVEKDEIIGKVIFCIRKL